MQVNDVNSAWTQECRWYLREPPHERYPQRRPHLNSPFQNENVMCLCPDCDEKLERELEQKFHNELCDCDIFTRWICHDCHWKELQFTGEYYKNHTKFEGGYINDEDEVSITKVMPDHQHSIAVSPHAPYKNGALSEGNFQSLKCS
jgi:hypothetical protein